MAKVNNPLILLDEIDKLGAHYKGDPASALLEALDKEQNFSFTDHYIDLPFDLSNVLFVTTANSTDTIPRPLLDRMEVIEISGYTRYEKFRIASDYLLKKQYREHKISKRAVNITESAVYSMIDFYVREAGVRNLERNIVNLIRKIEKDMLLSGVKSAKVDDGNIEKYLGRKKYTADKKNQFDEVGAALGLAWTAAGGDTLFCEAAAVSGSGKIQATGSLGDVMKESAKIAVTHIRSIADFLEIDKDFYKNKDIHIHFPDGATPKDGPSAGITVALAVTSALTGRKIRSDVAMTGEISIRGKVLPIGGLKEKAIAAHRAGVFNIIIPRENEKDLEDIPKEIFGDFNFMPVSSFGEVMEIALLPKEKAADNFIAIEGDGFGKYPIYPAHAQ
jgi:ATP-dependent Lon protease